ncbi:MAG: thiamine pyrophosphate-requiring protein [Dehalococcoidia bacterium]|jgi:acetolactate synthase-1/2/3 large subunit|nr:thiamine pyrophosphate-requiring protein [Dehalococcoidia bacterium]MDP7161690.1 thiamine pyrophosphate-requiring protein [Dehalococcoidia bacterium]MDP7213963.1 thiamine pyrophosphate-requiring protein [Dehalococcoidia bacterium]
MAQAKQYGSGADAMISVDQGADLFVESMLSNNVEYLFINSGTDTFPIQESLAKYIDRGQDVPETILCLDEKMGMAAAHGYFMISGRPQVLLVHVDSGTQAVGGAVHNAQRGRAGIVFCAGRAPYTYEGEMVGGKNMSIHWIQEQLDQAGGVRPFTKWDYEVRRPENLQRIMQRAFQVASSEPAGLVYVTLPREVLMAPMETTTIPAAARHGRATTPQADPEALSETAAILASARRPVIITSQSGRNKNVVAHMTQLAELTGAPVITERVRLSFPSDHPLSAPTAMEADYIRNADAILVVDTDIPWIPTNVRPAPDAAVVWIDQDPVKDSIPLWTFPADILMEADSSKAVPALVFEIREQMTAAQSQAASERAAKTGAAHEAITIQSRERSESLSTENPIAPDWLSHCLGQVMAPDDILLNEAVTNGGSVISNIPRTVPGTMHGSGGSSLGWALGAAFGARLAAPDKNVVCTVGDGAFVYGCPTSSIWAAQKYNAPFLTVIYNNQIHNAPRMATLGGYPEGVIDRTKNFVGMEIFPSPDYATLAVSCGAYGETVEDPAEVIPALKRAYAAIAEGQPAVLDVRLARPALS